MPQFSASPLVVGGLILLAVGMGVGSERSTAFPAERGTATQWQIPACPRFDVPADTIVTVWPDRPTAYLRRTAVIQFSGNTLPPEGASYRVRRSPRRMQWAEIGITPYSRGAPAQFAQPVQIRISYRDCDWRLAPQRSLIVLRTDLPSFVVVPSRDYRNDEFVDFTTAHFTDFALAIP